MRIAFYAEGEGPHLDIAKHLIASAKQHMPGVQICLLTDEKTPALEGAEAIRIPGDMPMGVRRVMHYCMPGEWLFLDTDVVFRKDVRDVFERDFDVALASRDGTYMEGSKYAELMPYNFGVVFSRNPCFWQTVLPELKKLSPDFQRWGGEQMLTCVLAQTGKFKAEILPSAYNFTPEKQDDDLSHVAIAHYKGARKAWITTYL